MNRRGFLRWLGLAPVVGPAAIRTLGDGRAQRALDVLKGLGDPLSRWFMRHWNPERVYPASWPIDGRVASGIEGVKRIGPGLEKYYRVMTARTADGWTTVVEHVEWLVKNGETVEGSTRWLK